MGGLLGIEKEMDELLERYPLTNNVIHILRMGPTFHESIDDDDDETSNEEDVLDEDMFEATSTSDNASDVDQRATGSSILSFDFVLITEDNIVFKCG